MSRPGAEELLQVGVVGATGALGSELIDVLGERSFPLTTLVPIATDRSLGVEVELAGEAFPVAAEPPSLEALDLLFLCAPRPVSLEYARRALQARVACIDATGALAAQGDVPLLVADLLDPERELDQPLLASPAGPALAWSLVLAPLAEAAGLRSVRGASLEAASVRGRAGLDALSGQSIAIFNQQAPPDGGAEGPVAFDCLPAVDTVDESGATAHERALAATLERLLDRSFELAATAVQVPTFRGDGAVLAVETERPLAADEARAALAKAPGVRVWPSASGPSTRTSVGHDGVLVGRVREVSAGGSALQLWLAADHLRLTAANAVKLAEVRPLRRS